MVSIIYEFPYPCGDSEYELCHPYTKKLFPGVYFFQAWGAQGGGINTIPLMGGKGGYASGILTVRVPTTFYVYVGHYGSSWNDNDKYAYNGGGLAKSSGGGGGATDFRLVNGEHNDTESLLSRVLVAGGGGGADQRDVNTYLGGVGGGVKGGDADNGNAKGGNQYEETTSSGTSINGKLGMGGSATCDTSSGGGGYYGGASGSCKGYGTGAGGGSGYASGHDDCQEHSSGVVFQNPVLIDGNNLFPTIDDTTFTKMETGHELNGHAKITLLSRLYINSCSSQHSTHLWILIIVILLYKKN